jgi:hypothetical protein
MSYYSDRLRKHNLLKSDLTSALIFYILLSSKGYKNFIDTEIQLFPPTDPLRPQTKCKT